MGTELPDWIAVGAKVAEYNSGGWRRESVSMTTVEKLTATQVVCSSGSRYRLGATGGVAGGLRGVGSNDAELLPVANDRIRRILASQRIDNIRYRIDKRLADLRGASTEALAALDDIENLVKAARAAIQNPEA